MTTPDQAATPALPTQMSSSDVTLLGRAREAQAQAQAQLQFVMDHVRTTYGLQPGDRLTAQGQILRAPQLPAEVPPKEIPQAAPATVRPIGSGKRGSRR